MQEAEAEEERRRKEEEERERARQEEAERNFDREGEMARLGGRLFEFDKEDPIKRSQHYEWLIPAYFKQPDKHDSEVNVLFLEARTTTVMRTLVPNVEVLEFGEIPVALRKT
mmetsp:Transcript_18333/g.13332  ORF Transcript_18333/g.13332 Transcript_18333/m.13332 type:complete len:112 (-) Transcript_18333:394-729(-)